MDQKTTDKNTQDNAGYDEQLFTRHSLVPLHSSTHRTPNRRFSNAQLRFVHHSHLQANIAQQLELGLSATQLPENFETLFQDETSVLTLAAFLR